MVGALNQKGMVSQKTAQSLVLIAKPGSEHTGVGRYVSALHRHLTESGYRAIRTPPALPPLSGFASPLTRKLGMDLAAFFRTYPVWAHYPEADVYHLTSQNLASLLVFRPPVGATVVTVHDIIPYMLRDHAELCPYRGKSDRWFDRLAMKALGRADILVADSHFTKQSLITKLGMPSTKIEVVHLGIDHSLFRFVNPHYETRQRYALPDNRRYLIYVGSEDPRKNLGILLKALARLRAEGSQVDLIKVGKAHFNQERERLLLQARQLGIQSSVHFLDDVPEDELPALYSIADVCVMPSLYEGFGFPVLEAMACGTPVVCSNAASLPELVGDAALLFSPGPGSDERLASLVGWILNDDGLRSSLSHKGKRQAAKFTWAETASQMLDVYRELREKPGLMSSPSTGHDR